MGKEGETKKTFYILAMHPSPSPPQPISPSAPQPLSLSSSHPPLILSATHQPLSLMSLCVYTASVNHLYSPDSLPILGAGGQIQRGTSMVPDVATLWKLNPKLTRKTVGTTQVRFLLLLFLV